MPILHPFLLVFFRLPTVFAGYLVEKCEVGSDFWQPVPGYCPNTTYTVRNLEEGKQYKFRVRAENIYGISEPLEGKPVTAKNPFGESGRWARVNLVQGASSAMVTDNGVRRPTRLYLLFIYSFHILSGCEGIKEGSGLQCLVTRKEKK